MWKKEEISLLSLMIIISIKSDEHLEQKVYHNLYILETDDHYHFYIHTLAKVRLMSISQCAGSRINISCGDSDWLVNIFYETYAFVSNATAKNCRSDIYECSDTEFQDAESSRECTGQANCSFIVKTNRFLTSCLQNATILTVHYDCIPKIQIFNMCSNFTYRHGYSVYLMSPGYPGNQLPVSNCECQISGKGINGTILDHVKDGNSPVIMMIITQSFTYHINSVKVLNTATFYNASKAIVIVNNRHSKQTFKLWMGFKGNGMTVICGSGDPIKPTTVLPSVLQTVVMTSSVLFPSNDFTGITNTVDYFTTAAQSNIQTVPLSTTSKEQTKIKSLEIPTKSKFSSNIINPSTSSSSSSLSSSSSSTSSIVISLNSTNGKNNTPGTADYTDLYLIIGVSCLLLVLLIIIIIMAVLIVRKEKAKHRYDQYSLEGNDNVIFAYGSLNHDTGSNEEDEIDIA